MTREISYQKESVATLWDELLPIVKQNYRETAQYQDIKLAPDFERYEALEAAGGIVVYTARVDGKLAGYCSFVVSMNLNYSGSKQALQNVIFLLPEYRKEGIGAGLIEFSDQQLQLLGCEVVYHHVKAKESLDFSPTLEKLGYRLVERVYGRRL